MLERSSLEQAGAGKAAFPEGAPSMRHALARLTLERHSLKAVHEEDDPDVQQVEMLLQAYFIQMDNIFNQLATMNEYISDTEVGLDAAQLSCSPRSSRAALFQCEGCW